MDNKTQILKCGDDRHPVYLEMDEKETFRRSKGDESQCSWLKSEDAAEPRKLRSRIEPWLTALFQSEHLSLLVGSGITHAVHHMATEEPLPGMGSVEFKSDKNIIDAAANKSAEAAGRKAGNIEDQIRVANELLRGLEILEAGDSGSSKVQNLSNEISDILSSFAESILRGESSLAKSHAGKRENALSYLVSFLMSFASRTGTRDRLQIFTTNYDRYIELGAEAAGLHLLDRFIGSLAPIFRSSRLEVDMHYNPPGIRGEPRYLEGVARFTKLHGSVDWTEIDGSIRRIGLPFGAEGIDQYLKASGLKGVRPLRLMIYPNSAKDRETASYPYVELFRDFAAATCRPNSTLVCFGYSFGDEHINRVVEDMLTIPSAHLVIISYGDPLGRIMKIYNQIGRPPQISLLVGSHFGNLQKLVDYYLPKPAIDRTMFRMADILRSRLGSGSEKNPSASGNTVVQGGDNS